MKYVVLDFAKSDKVVLVAFSSNGFQEIVDTMRFIEKSPNPRITAEFSYQGIDHSLNTFKVAFLTRGDIEHLREFEDVDLTVSIFCPIKDSYGIELHDHEDFTLKITQSQRVFLEFQNPDTGEYIRSYDIFGYFR